jgi:hypothetical protein
MLYISGVLNPKSSLTSGRYLKIFLGGSAALLILCFTSNLLCRPYVVWVYGMYALTPCNTPIEDILVGVEKAV